MSVGKVMDHVTDKRAREDDEHTEAEDIESGEDAPNYMFLIGKPGAKEVVRGFASEEARIPAGAALYEQSTEDWDDFTTRAYLSRDVDPQMRALDSGNDAADQAIADQAIRRLIEAAEVLEAEERQAEEKRKSSAPAPPLAFGTLDGASDEPMPQALSFLADTALSYTAPQPLPQMRADPPPPPHHMGMAGMQDERSWASAATGPVDPRQYVLPRPTPTQPRRLLPARGQMALPDPFAMNGPPQLPPPPGSNFARLPMPSYLPGPPGPPPGPPGPPSLYFPSPHGHAPRRY